VQSALGEKLTGLYVGGSLASGGFEPGRSDIDFLAVTEDVLDPGEIERVIRMHKRLGAEGGSWAAVLEGSYFPRAALRRYDPAFAMHPALRVDGSFDIDGHGSDWILLSYLFRKCGIVLAGPNPEMLIDPIAPGDLRRAARGILEEWWAPMLQDTSRLRSDEYQAYAVLTMCRSRYTLEKGDVVSKQAAAAFAQALLGPPRAGLIEQALGWRHGDAFDRLPDVLDFIRETLEFACKSSASNPSM